MSETATSTSSSSSSGSSSSSHTHTWQANTTQQWVVDQEGYYETTSVGYVECYCGETFDVATDWSAHRIEILRLLRAGETTEEEYAKHVGWTRRYKTVETWVNEVGHYETVTTGYTCTSCGATKST